MKILLLAGTSEARDLAERLSGAGHDVTASLSGATRAPAAQGVKTRVGGFGGETGFRSYIADTAPDLVVDATHPFAIRITRRTATICADLGVPYLQLLRPEWKTKQGEAWTEIGAAAEASTYIAPQSRVFLATGRQTLLDFENLSQCYLICRQIDPPEGPFPFPNGEFLICRPPFSVADEIALFERLRIDWLVVKNAGGAASRSKIEAMAALGRGILVIRRPDQPDAPRVETVEAAMEWIERHADH